jgi:hypothetical protein
MSGARRLSLHRVPALKKRSKYKEENVPALFYNRIEMKTVRVTCDIHPKPLCPGLDHQNFGGFPVNHDIYDRPKSRKSE